MRHLLERGHWIRLFARHAENDCAQWAAGVEPRPGDVSEPTTVRGCAEGCDAVLHIVGVVAESPPDVTFETINVAGTRLILEEAERAGVRRFVYVSSLGADRGRSEYHRSKKQGEDLVRAFPGDWIICRAGNVYGPGDKVISLLLKLVRTLPVIPVPGGGDDPFQPIWADDLGRALALAVERSDLARQTLELAGAETTTLNEVLDHLERLTGKSPARLPLPGWLASIGAEAASTVGVDLPVTTDQITMLLEGNVIQPGRPNALVDVLGITPTPLADGLAKLADSLPEQLPSEGQGTLYRRRYWADVRNSRITPEQLMERFRERFSALVPNST
ncbi:MAG: NAD(P)H-binding protein, partial [Chloroflexota bacterium]|nr:NAD(P)H-binding protein [Chloroflexota bacterium]